MCGHVCACLSVVFVYFYIFLCKLMGFPVWAETPLEIWNKACGMINGGALRSIFNVINWTQGPAYLQSFDENE